MIKSIAIIVLLVLVLGMWASDYLQTRRLDALQEQVGNLNFFKDAVSRGAWIWGRVSSDSAYIYQPAAGIMARLGALENLVNELDESIFDLAHRDFQSVTWEVGTKARLDSLEAAWETFLWNQAKMNEIAVDYLNVRAINTILELSK